MLPFALLQRHRVNNGEQILRICGAAHAMFHQKDHVGTVGWKYVWTSSTSIEIGTDIRRGLVCWLIAGTQFLHRRTG